MDLEPETKIEGAERKREESRGWEEGCWLRRKLVMLEKELPLAAMFTPTKLDL